MLQHGLINCSFYTRFPELRALQLQVHQSSSLGWGAAVRARQRSWRPSASSRSKAGGERHSAAASPSRPGTPLSAEGLKELQKQINRELCATKSAQGVLSVVAERFDDLGDVNAITAFHRLAKHAGNAKGAAGRAQAQVLGSPLLAQLVAYLERAEMEWSAVGVASVLWAHAVLGHGSKALVNKAYKQLDRITAEDTARCYCLLVYAMARLQRPHAGYLRRLTAALTAEVAHQRGQQAQQGHAGGEEARVQEGTNGGGPNSSSSSNGFVSGQQQQHLLGGVPTQQLCLLAYSLASVGCTDGQALRACLDEVARRDLGAMSTVSLCQVTRALVAWGEYHAGACDTVALAVARLPDTALDGESCCRLVHDYGLIYQRLLTGEGHNPSHRLDWQTAVRGHVNKVPARRAMLRQLALRSLQEVGSMGSVSLSSLVWGLATLGQREGPLLDAIAARALRLGTRLDAQAVASICWAFAALSHDHPQLLEGLAATTLALLQDPVRRTELSAQAVPMLALSFAVLNRCDTEPARAMLQELAVRAEEVLPELTPQGLANLGWALAVAAVYPTSLFHAWRVAVGACLPRFGPLELNQLHQTEVALRVEAPHVGIDAPVPFHSLLESLYQSGRLRSTAKRGWERGQQWGHRNVTRWQEKIFLCLTGLGVPCELEYLGAGGEYSVDIAIPSHRIAVECDGPSHFMANSRHVEGGTALKHRLLEGQGWRVVAVRYFEWPASRRRQPLFLAARLGEAGYDVSLPPSVQRQSKLQQQQQQPAATAIGSSGSSQLPDEALAGAAVHKPAQQSSNSSTAATAVFKQPPNGLEQEGAAAPASTPSVPAASMPERAQAAGASVGQPTGKEGYGQGEREQGQGPAGGPASGDGGSEAEEKEQGSSTGGGKGAIRERAGRLAMLQYKSGKLSRTQLLTRHGKAAPVAKPDLPEGRSS